MKKTLILLYCITALAVGCNGNNKTSATADAPAADSAAAATDVAAADDDYPAAEQAALDLSERVKAIYDHLHRAYENDGEEGSDLDLDELYCSQDWRSTVAAVREKDMALDGIGFFEADYWVMGQEAGNVHATDIFVEKILTDEGKGEASVTLKLHNYDNVTPVRVDLVLVDGVWMVDNFTDLAHDFNWKAEMKKYLRQ